MIIPVAFEVKRKDVEEDFDVSNRLGDIVSGPVLRDMRITVKLYDTDTHRGFGFSARVVHDDDAPWGHELMTMFALKGDPSDEHQNYLRKLRDEINRVLGED